MSAPPEPEMRRASSVKPAPKSQTLEVISKKESDSTQFDFQARRLRQLFFFANDTARTIALLAFARGG
jgi:hypothetical protein